MTDPAEDSIDRRRGPERSPSEDGAIESLRRRPSWWAILVVGALLATLLIAWLSMDVVYTVSGSQIHQGRTVGYVYLPAQVPIRGAGARLELYENGAPLGPRVEDHHRVRAEGGGAYALRNPGWPRSSIVHFSATDGTGPRANGRRYTLRHPRHQLPAAVGLAGIVWGTLWVVALRLRRPAPVVDPGDGPAVGIAGWSAVVGLCLYTLFVAQAWLEPSNTHWLLIVLAAALPSLLFRLERSVLPSADRRLPPRWAFWLIGLLAWMGVIGSVGSSHASYAPWVTVVAGCAWGGAVLWGFRGELAGALTRAPLILAGLFLAVVCIGLLRHAGFDLDGRLAALGLSRPWPDRGVNPWTTKFLAHWTLVVGWWTVGALGGPGARTAWRSGIGRWPVVGGTLLLGLAAVGLAGSKTGCVALAVSVCVAACAVRWPRVSRRVLLATVVTGLLGAPLLAGLPWRAASALDGAPGSPSSGVLDALELEARGSIWERARRLILQRPLTGWGPGAGRTLPAGELVGGAADGESASSGNEAGGEPPGAGSTLPGGHPHNAALLVWLDLGLVGVLLVAGLLVEAGRKIAAVEGQRCLHAALLGLLTTTVVFLTFNYPIWRAEIVSILWMSAALPAMLSSGVGAEGEGVGSRGAAERRGGVSRS